MKTHLLLLSSLLLFTTPIKAETQEEFLFKCVMDMSKNMEWSDDKRANSYIMSYNIMLCECYTNQMFFTKTTIKEVASDIVVFCENYIDNMVDTTIKESKK